VPDTSSFALTVSYNGGGYAGFARQKDPRLSTIQETLEEALAIILGVAAVPTVCAGRTDAGVHARAQVVSFEVDCEQAAQLDGARFLHSVNALIPDSISATALRRARPGFSARFDALEREYRYRICNRSAPPLFSREFCCHIPRELNVAAMEHSAQALMGEHDFRSFSVTASSEGKKTVREIRQMDFLFYEAFGEPLITLRIIGNAFLHSMVRTIAGTLIEVGLGREDEDFVRAALIARKRAAAGPTAPARGLTLHDVSYPDDVWL
jgi:tRNA pseudouridine38-40 synthase